MHRSCRAGELVPLSAALQPNRLLMQRLFILNMRCARNSDQTKLTVQAGHHAIQVWFAATIKQFYLDGS